MTRYQLLKLVTWANPLYSRKRLQKVVFLLQTVGCPLEVDFILHHYGPYSEDISRLADELVRLDLLEETATENSVGQQYSYRLSENAREKMGSLEETERGREMAQQMADFEVLGRSLLQADLRELEVAATMLYFRQQGHDWAKATEKTCAYKSIPTDSPLIGKAENMARGLEGSGRKTAG